MIRYELAHPGDEEKIVDFANYVFSQAHQPHDFRTLMPKVYGAGVENASIHYVAYDEKDQIRAMVACLPLQLNICDQQLKLGMVGTVSVHPYARGEGHMKQLMALMRKESLKQGMDLLALGGRRQRYQYFGFDTAGIRISFSINQANIHHALALVDDTPFTFQQVFSASDPLSLACHALYEQQLVHGGRPQDRYPIIAQTWNAKLFAVLKNGNFCGQLIAPADFHGEISELLLTDETDLPAIIKKWMAEHPQNAITLDVYPYEKNRLHLLESFAEGYYIRPSDLISILHAEPFLRAMFRLQTHARSLQDGERVIQIGDECLLVKIQNGEPSCEACTRTPDLVLSPMAAIPALFTPLRAFDFSDSLLQQWLPLPWGLPSPEHF